MDGMYNSEQLDYMRSLASLAPETKCWCGWYRLGKCPHCPPDVTCRDKMRVACSRCGNAPHRPGSKLVHLKGCAGMPEKRAPRIGCPDLDPNWPDHMRGDKPRGPRLCVLYPNCKCGDQDRNEGRPLAQPDRNGRVPTEHQI